MSKVRVLVNMFLTQPVQMIWVNIIPASIVDLNLRLLSWLGWIKLFVAIANWSFSLITFSISLLTVLSRTIGLKDFSKSYDFLLDLGMTTIIDFLKYKGQYSNSIHTLVIWIIILRHSSSLRILLRWLHINLSVPGTEELLQLDKANLNSSFEKVGQGKIDLLVISSRIFISTCWWRAVLKVEWRAFHKLLISRHYWLLYLMVLMVGNLYLLTQFMNSQGLCFLLVISWILTSKNDRFIDLTLILKIFQFSRLLVVL